MTHEERGAALAAWQVGMTTRIENTTDVEEQIETRVTVRSLTAPAAGTVSAWEQDGKVTAAPVLCVGGCEFTRRVRWGADNFGRFTDHWFSIESFTLGRDVLMLPDCEIPHYLGMAPSAEEAETWFAASAQRMFLNQTERAKPPPTPLPTPPGVDPANAARMAKTAAKLPPRKR